MWQQAECWVDKPVRISASLRVLDLGRAGSHHGRRGEGGASGDCGEGKSGVSVSIGTVDVILIHKSNILSMYTV